MALKFIRNRRLLLQIAVIAGVVVWSYILFSWGARWAEVRDADSIQTVASPQSGSHVKPAEHAHQETETVEATIWTCPMHPQIKMNEPGKCPICGMELVPEETLRSDADSSQRRLVVSPEARALANIETAPVERKWIENTIRMVGLIDYDETRLANVTAYVGGRLDRLFVDYTGTQVNKGDHMVHLYSPDLISAQQELLQAKLALGRLTNSANDVTRQATVKTLEASRDRLRLWGLTAAQIDEIEARGTIEDRVIIYAPLGGIVIQKHLQEGSYVKTGDRIYTIADLDHLWVRLKAYESDLPWLRYGQEVTFTTEAYADESFHGLISFIEPTLDTMTRTVNVRVNVDNRDKRLKPGMFVRAEVRSRIAKGGKVLDANLAGKWIGPMHPEIVRDEPGKCPICGMDLVPAEKFGYVAEIGELPPLVIPASAALITGKRAVVYVQISNQGLPTYEGREIELGSKAADSFIVLSGLSEGERVVVNGAFRIDSALQIQAKKSMMNPEGAKPAMAHDHGAR